MHMPRSHDLTVCMTRSVICFSTWSVECDRPEMMWLPQLGLSKPCSFLFPLEHDPEDPSGGCSSFPEDVSIPRKKKRSLAHR